MFKGFEELKNWDLTSMGYYSYLDFKHLEKLKTKFQVGVNSEYARDNNLEPSYIYKYSDNADWRHYRVENHLSDVHEKKIKKHNSALYCTQSETRDVNSQDSLLYLNFPLKHIRDDVKNTMWGEFDYDVVDEFMQRLDEKNCSNEEWIKLNNEFNKKYPEKKEEQYIWNRNAALDLHSSFKIYGQLNIPIIDRAFDMFTGSSHTFFHSCYLKRDYLRLFIKVPSVEVVGNKKLLQSWYSLLSPNLFSHGHYSESKIFYMYYFDLKNEKIYYKKYPKEKYKPMYDAHNRIPQDLYKEFSDLEV